MIYFDNAATTLIKPPAVAQLVAEGIASGQYGNPGRGSHRTAIAALEQLYLTRQVVAKLVHIPHANNIALTQNASASLNLVLNSLFRNTDGHVITTVCEHNSVLRPLYMLERQGLKVSRVGIRPDGTLRYDAFESEIRSDTKAIIITHASNVTGNKTDLDAVYKTAKKHGLMLIVDASQTAGSSEIDCCRYPQSIFCFTGHKGLFGPEGTGVIAVNGSFDFQPVFAGGSGFHSFDHEHPHTMPDVFEVGTMNVPCFMGLRGGVEFILDTGLEKIAAHIQVLKQRFLAGLANIPHITVYGDKKPDSSGIVSINIADLPSSDVSGRLDEFFDVETRPGAHCAPLIHEAFGTKEQGMVRFSFSYFNTLAEVDTALEAIAEIAKAV